MKKILKLILFFIIIYMTAISNSYAQTDPEICGKAAILIDQESGRILYQKNINDKMPFASLTKMMTLLISLEAIENNDVTQNDIVTISKKAAKTKGSTYKLKENEQVELIELMKGLMIVSGNDAAVAIAEHIGKSEKNFVKMMNMKSKELGMKNTFFINPNGLPIYDEEHNVIPKENISTARDLSILSKYLLDKYKKEVLSITSIKSYSNEKRNYVRNNTNRLLYIISEVDGIKTGYSGRAGYCLAFTMDVKKRSENEKDYRLIGILLGSGNSKDRLKGSKNILLYGKDNFVKQKVVNKDEHINKVYLKEIDNYPIYLKSKESLYIIKEKNEQIQKKINLTNLEYPIKKGDKIGELCYIGKNKENLGHVDLISNNELKYIPLDILIKLIGKNILN